MTTSRCSIRRIRSLLGTGSMESSVLVTLIVIALSISCASCAAIGCASAPEVPPSAALAAAPTADRASGQGVVLDLASRDLECPRAGTNLVLSFDNTDHSNSSMPRYVVDGCGQRAIYAEACGFSTCQYLLISRFSLKPVEHQPSAGQ